MRTTNKITLAAIAVCFLMAACETVPLKNEPLITHMFTADPSAHVFDGRLYIYPSHDRDEDLPANQAGDHYDMRDYHVFSMTSIPGEVTDHGVALALEDIPWAKRQLWAPDAAYKDGKYYLYFPAKDHDDIFRIGVAVSDSPSGPFRALPQPIAGANSIDPAVFVDDDGQAYMFWGGLWGGQLEKWVDGQYVADALGPGNLDRALGPLAARLSPSMTELAQEPVEVVILDETGKKIYGGDQYRRFFEGVWVHKYRGTYYLSYSTGTTHMIVYATSDNPLGPYTYRGMVLDQVVGWTTHHSIVEFRGEWFLFYHDATLSGGKDNKRNLKVRRLEYREDGTIVPMNPRK